MTFDLEEEVRGLIAEGYQVDNEGYGHYQNVTIILNKLSNEDLLGYISRALQERLK